MQKYIGDRAFYRRVMAVLIPILTQHVITNFVAMLDNIMVGQIGTEPMSGVAIVNQILFVYNLCIIGGVGGAGILTAQYYGKRDVEGIRWSIRVKCAIALGAFLLFGTLLVLFGGNFISLFLHEGEEGLDLAAAMRYAQDYLRVMLFQTLPFAVSMVYASTLRETGETVLPMKAGIIAVFVNLVFNYILIFGKLGMPALGVTGAAIATVLSRLVELGILVGWTHRHGESNPAFTGLYRSFHVPKTVVRQVIVLGLPLLANELLWSGGMTTLMQCYSLRGLEVISAMNISSTISNLFFSAFIATGNATAIIVGQLLGAGETERAVDEDRKLIALALAISLVIGILIALLAPVFPLLYNTVTQVRHLATRILLISAMMMPLHAFANSCYFTLRSGGKTFITFLFDSGSLWMLSLPAALVLSRFTTVPIVPMYLIVEGIGLIKCAVGYVMVRRRRWAVNLVAGGDSA